MRRKRYVTSEFHCPECEFVMPLPRNCGRQREKGHIKNIWCPQCKKEMRFKEIRYIESYKTMDGEMIGK